MALHYCPLRRIEGTCTEERERKSHVDFSGHSPSPASHCVWNEADIQRQEPCGLLHPGEGRGGAPDFGENEKEERWLETGLTPNDDICLQLFEILALAVVQDCVTMYLLQHSRCTQLQYSGHNSYCTWVKTGHQVLESRGSRYLKAVELCWRIYNFLRDSICWSVPLNLPPCIKHDEIKSCNCECRSTRVASFLS